MPPKLPTLTTWTLGSLAAELEGDLLDPSHADLRVTTVRGIPEAEFGSLTYVEAAGRLGEALATPCAAVLVPLGTACTARPCVAVRHPRLAFARALGMFHPPPAATAGIHPTACVAATARIDPRVSVGPLARIDEGASLEAGVVVEALAHVGGYAHVGHDSRVCAAAFVAPHTRLGRRVVLHGRCVVGAATVPGTASGAEVADDVEIGARSAVMAGARIGAGTKIDNLAYVGPAAQVGRACLLVSHSCLGAGSVLEDGCVLAAQAFARAGVRMGTRAIAGGRSVVCSDIPAGSVVSGEPARPHREEMRRMAHVQRLAEIRARVEGLERRLETLRSV